MRFEETTILYLLWIVCGVLGVLINYFRGDYKNESFWDALPWIIFFVFVCGGLHLYGTAERWRLGK
jgi:hypothetical protein